MEQSKNTRRTSFLKRNRIPVLIIAIITLFVIGYFAILRSSTETKKQTVATIYTCPMHPQIQSEKPGECPICGMKLVPKRAATNDSMAAMKQDAVTISTTEAIKANVQTVAVTSKEFISDIQTIGRIKIAEPNEHVLTARTRGRIERLYVNATGAAVRKGEPVYDIYSPDLANAEQEYLIAKKSRITASTEHGHASINEGLIAAGKKRLQLYGLSENQILELEKTNVPRTTITVLSPQSGIVLQKLVQEGSYVDEGTSLFQLADLSVVWAEIEVPESAIRFVHEGTSVTITSSAFPSDKFSGKIIYIFPVENPESHTIAVRLTLLNSSRKLRPEMFVNANIHINMGNALAVPASAVTQTGTKNYVWIRNSDGSFSSRTLTIGALSTDNYYQILSGIREGEEVAVSGEFLIESEHQFAQGSNPMAGMNMGEQKTKGSGEGTGTVRSIDTKQQMITLDHGNIPGVMSAMTMGYKVSNPALLEKAVSGDHVKFTLSRSESGEYVISSITKQ